MQEEGKEDRWEKGVDSKKKRDVEEEETSERSREAEPLDVRLDSSV